MALKKDLEKALDLIAEAQEAKGDKEVKKVVADSDKFEKSVDKELAEKVDSIVNNIVNHESTEKAPASVKKVEGELKTGDANDATTIEESAKIAAASPNAPKKDKMSPEEEQKWLKERLRKLPGRVQVPD